ncbi:MAG TPA: site-specific integrase [Methanocorpusculum sp.]|nr:site-specific integrase [Methanocorpusculum sp.]
MTSSANIDDYPKLLNPALIRGVSEKNATLLRRFIDRQRLNGVSLNAINTGVHRLSSWIRTIGKDDALEWTIEDIESAYLHKSDETSRGYRSNTTLDGELRILKQFWHFLNPDKPPVTIRRKPTKLSIANSDIASTEQILQMRDAAERAGDIRGAAMIMALLGTGCRVSELLDANIKDLTIGRQFAIISVDGKTGQRKVPFVTGLPELQRWVNMHPVRLPDGTVDPQAPLFVTYQSRGHTTDRLSKRRADYIMDKYKKAAGIPDHVKAHPHALRHRGATEDARNLTQKELCLKYGWSGYSDMPKRYTHTDQAQLERTILEAAGIRLPQEPPKTKTVTQCPRCGAVNRAGAMFCDVCSLPLNRDFEIDLIKTKQTIRTIADDKQD